MLLYKFEFSDLVLVEFVEIQFCWFWKFYDKVQNFGQKFKRKFKKIQKWNIKVKEAKKKYLQHSKVFYILCLFV